MSVAALWLVVSGPEVARIVAMTGDRLTVGRDLTCDVVLDDPQVSRRHAEIVCDPTGGCVLTDLSSRNGTTVNGRQLVGSVRLQGGEILRVGRTTVEVSLTEPGSDE